MEPPVVVVDRDRPSQDTSHATPAVSRTASTAVVVVNGIRYIRPYLRYQTYSVRLHHVGWPVVDVLASALKRQHCTVEETRDHFCREILDGRRIQLKRQKRHRHDTSQYTQDYEPVVDPNMLTLKNDRLRMMRHVHERCVIGTPIVQIPMLTKNLNVNVNDSGDSGGGNNSDKSASRASSTPSSPPYMAVFKPAGLAVVGDGTDGAGEGQNSLQGIFVPKNYFLGHRIDLPVAGVVLLGKGKGRAKTLMEALAPQAKAEQTTMGVSSAAKGLEHGSLPRSFVKAYLARVKGSLWSAGNHDDDDKMVEVKRQLIWDNRKKKALVVNAEDNKKDKKMNALTSIDLKKGSTETYKDSKRQVKDTVTRVQKLHYHAKSNTTLVRVELISGARQQIRAVLASLGTPIVGDEIYGGGGEIGAAWDGSTIDEDKQDGQQPNDGQAAIATTNQPVEESLRLYRDDEHGTLQRMLDEEHQDWCDKCRWQRQVVQNGGTTQGAAKLTHQICLLSYHYCIPRLNIDAKVPDHLMPEWAKIQ